MTTYLALAVALLVAVLIIRRLRRDARRERHDAAIRRRLDEIEREARRADVLPFRGRNRRRA